MIAGMLTDAVTNTALAVKTTITVFNPPSVSFIVGMPPNALGNVGGIDDVSTHPYMFSRGKEL